MEDILNHALLLFGSSVLALLTAGLALLTNWIAKKIKSEHWAAVVMKTDDVAIKVIRDVYQAYVEPLKAANADGKLTEDEKRNAKAMAIQQIKSYLGAKGLNELASLLSAGKIDEYLSSVVENAVSNSKNAAADPS